MPPLTQHQMGRPGRPVLCLVDGNPYRRFESISQAALFLAGQGHPNARASSLHKALAMPGHTAYGFTWGYDDRA